MLEESTFEVGNNTGLPFNDNTVMGTTRGDGEDEVENGEENAPSSLPLG